MPNFSRVVLFGCGLFISAALPQATATAQQGNTPVTMPAGIIVSPETTVVSGPARSPEGIDFLAAINRKMKEGVTPENNADVLLLQAIGKATFLPIGSREPYLAELGISKDSLAAGKYRSPRGDALGSLNAVTGKLWSESEQPAAAEWIASIDAVLNGVHKATHRPKFYSPLVLEFESARNPRTIAAVLPTLRTYYNVGTALTTRAMLRTHQRKIDAAWSDLIAAYRLGRLIRRHPTELGCLTGTLIELAAAKATIVFAHAANLTADEARRFRQDIEQLPERVPLSDTIDFATRLTCLDAACFLAGKGLNYIPQLSTDGPGTTPRYDVGAVLNLQNSTDWNKVLRTINGRYDRLKVAMSQQTFAQRKQAVNTIVAAQKSERAEMQRVLLSAQPRQPDAERTLDVLIDAIVGPQLEKITKPEEELNARFDQARIALALAEFRHKQEKYPPSLAELSPEFLQEVPRDRYTEQELKYEVSGNGYKLFAGGPNLQDDSGNLDDIGMNTTELNVLTRSATSDSIDATDDNSISNGNIPVGTILAVVGGGAGTILLFVVGILGWQKFSSGKKRGKKKNRKGSPSSRQRRSSTGAPPRRSQRRNH